MNNRILALLLAAIFLICAPGHSQNRREPFLPLAGLTITAPASQGTQLVDALKSFARAENLRVEEGNFYKAGRLVINMTLRFDDECFFQMDNFSESNVFDLNVYSHGKREQWEAVWMRLNDKLSELLGAQSITKKF